MLNTRGVKSVTQGAQRPGASALVGDLEWKQEGVRLGAPVEKYVATGRGRHFRRCPFYGVGVKYLIAPPTGCC